MKKQNKLEKKIKKAMEKALESTAYELTEKIEDGYKNAIRAFYQSYPNPSSYDRTFETYTASDHYGKNLNKPISRINDFYIAGINISSNNISGNPYRADKDWVFERTFNQGIHGYTHNEYKEWMESAKLKRTVRRDKYRIKLSWNKGMSKMKQPPREIMDKWFKREFMTKKGQAETDRIFTKELTNALK